MAEHPNASRLRDGYMAFGKGDFQALDDLFDEGIKWHVGGRNQLAGDYDGRAGVYEFFGKIMQVTDGSFAIDVHAILADDSHAAVLVTASGSRGGINAEIKEVHVFHLRDDRVTEFWDATTDQYAADALFG